MKKFISVALVASMVASMGVTAFADTDYLYKDKQLEFHNEMLYDGRGADELWVPILMDGRFIVDSNRDAQDVVDGLLEQHVIAMAEWALYAEIVNALDAGTDGVNTFRTKEDISTYLSGKGVKELLATDKDIAGDSSFATYVEQLKFAYKEGPYKAAKAQVKSLYQLMDMMGADFTYLADADVPNSDEILTAEGALVTSLSAGYRGISAAVVDDAKAPVDIDDIEDVNEVEIEWKAKRGGNLVANVDIDEVDDLGGIYCVVFELNDNLGTAVQYFNGTLRMENGKNRELDEQDIRYNYYNKAAYSVTTYTNGLVGDLNNGYEMDATDNYINLVDFNDNYTICFFKKNAEWLELEDNNGFYYEVELSDQGKINLIYNNEAIDAVTDVASVDAVLAFYNFEARPIFDFPGKVVITPNDEFLEEKDIEELYLYTYNKDGSLKAVKTRLGEDGDTLEFRTSQLGKFVLSTEQLTLLSDAERAALEALKEAEANGETVVEDAVVADEKANPSTGC